MRKISVIIAAFLAALTAVAQDAKVFETDLSSAEAFPVNYGTESAREQKQDLQAWLCSASFKRLDMNEVLTNGINMKYKPEVEMTISGEVKYRSGKVLKKGRVVGYNFEDGKTNETSIDENGHFELPVYDFSNGDSFFLQAYDSEDNADVYNYEMQSDTLPAMYNWVRDKQQTFLNDTFSEHDLSRFGLKDSNILPNLVVKGRVKKDNHVPTNRFYSTRYMDSEQIAKKGIRDFTQLMQQFAGIITFTGSYGYNPNTPEYTGGAVSARGMSTLKEDNYMPFILDGIVVDVAQVMNLDPYDILSVEIAAPWQTMAMVGGYGKINGAVIIKTKQYNADEVVSKGIRYTPQGLSNLHEKIDQ